LPEGGKWLRYGQSKAGNILLATYMAHHWSPDGILSFSLNPGGIKTELQRHWDNGGIAQWMVDAFMLHPAPMGAITQLYAGTSPELTVKDNNQYFIPWARRANPKKGTQDLDLANRLWEFLEKDTARKY
jgi:retinol dehydrogenase 12